MITPFYTRSRYTRLFRILGVVSFHPFLRSRLSSSVRQTRARGPFQPTDRGTTRFPSRVKPSGLSDYDDRDDSNVFKIFLRRRFSSFFQTLPNAFVFDTNHVFYIYIYKVTIFSRVRATWTDAVHRVVRERISRSNDYRRFGGVRGTTRNR